MERASKFQEVWQEMHARVHNPRQMLTIPFVDMILIDLVVDAEDLYAGFVQRAEGSQTDMGMAIYLSALRYDIRVGRMRHKFWVPTEYMLANIGTKLLEDGTAPDVDLLNQVLCSGKYTCLPSYKFNGKDL